jgi:hypothetical protein
MMLMKFWYLARLAPWDFCPRNSFHIKALLAMPLAPKKYVPRGRSNDEVLPKTKEKKRKKPPQEKMHVPFLGRQYGGPRNLGGVGSSAIRSRGM